MRAERIGLYPGTFDPLHNGHYDIIRRAAKLVDRLVIGVAVNVSKNPMFTLEERVEMLREELPPLLGDLVDVRPFENLLMHFAEQVDASVIIRGLRALSDFEFEIQMVGMNARLNKEVETIFLMASDSSQFISSSLVKEIALLEGDISPFLSPAITARLRKKLAER
ncbi:MAG: pantetheine-phosphate adenylyltransferase [Alphaproteobacteria bacterium]|nr:pantetheine-phosphate adenylyltransferase [Alphaproteobacteria bacterium]